MVLIVDGNLEPVAHGKRKTSLLGKYFQITAAVGLNNYYLNVNKKIKFIFLLKNTEKYKMNKLKS